MKRILSLLAVLSFAVLAAPLVQAAPPPLNLPVGDWAVNANGSHGTLHITGIDAAGNIQPGSTIFGNPIIGFYDSTAAHINFIRIIGGGTSFEQVYNGYLFRDTVTPLLFALAGDFYAYQGTGATAQRSTFGWFATHRIIIFSAPGSSPVPSPAPE